MANTKSALKNIRKNKARYLQNRSVSSRLKTLEKKFLSAVEEKNGELAKEISTSLISALDKAQKNNLVHANKVSRKKSRCAQLLGGLSA
ncbi:MAG TPA: 30S ribosomal protein S20 [Opitutae bacterium]|nr:30S ribosomal protein S20 [Opitutae bacterium]|tara:strand:+ start:78 stop:344 length:267 start_codon:yes stop_codon:yes gene_type:complete